MIKRGAIAANVATPTSVEEFVISNTSTPRATIRAQ